MVVVKKSFNVYGTAIATTSVFLTVASNTVLAAPSQVGVITGLTVGDRACYVTLENEAGEVSTEFAAFEICAQDLVGKHVQLTYESGEIVAEACEGNLDCGLSETVLLITAAEVIPSAQSKQPQSPTFLTTAAEISQLEGALAIGQESWFGLAGLNKVEHPPELPEELITYRQNWQKKDPAIAPFLGLWHDDEYSNNRYHVSVFPSATIPSYVCVLEFKPEWSMNLEGENAQKDTISEGIFSVSLAKAGSAQLIGAELRSYELAIAETEFGVSETYPVELAPFMDEADNIRILAAAGLPAIPSNLSEDQMVRSLQVLLTHGCLDPSSSSR